MLVSASKGLGRSPTSIGALKPRHPSPVFLETPFYYSASTDAQV